MTDDTKQEETAEESRPAVVVFRVKDPDGTLRTEIGLQGVEPDMVQTLLELATASWRQQIGLPPR